MSEINWTDGEVYSPAIRAHAATKDGVELTVNEFDSFVTWRAELEIKDAGGVTRKLNAHSGVVNGISVDGCKELSAVAAGELLIVAGAAGWL